MPTSDELNAERIAAMAAAARVPLAAAASARVARTVAPTQARFAALGVTIAFEIEPSTFLVVGRSEIGDRSEIGK